ncbi:MAG: type IV pilus modification protein PilV, partial [Acidiferrobacterales bacterium]
EVLVALLILSIGLLGLAALQTAGLRFNTQSYQRTQAVLNAYDIIDRIRANPGGMNASNYDDIDLAYTASGTDCMGATCTTAQMADYDIGQWKASLTAVLSQGQGGICRGTLTVNPYNCTVDATATQFMVGITWMENDITQSLAVEAQL